MVFKKFTLLIIVRVFLILLCCLALGYAFTNQKYITASVLTGLLALLVANLIAFNNRTNFTVYRFFEALKNRDLTLAFDENEKDTVLRHIHRNFNQIISVIKDARLEKESHHNYLKSLVEHVGVGLLSFDEKGEVDLFNETAQQMFGIPYLKNIAYLSRIDVHLPPVFLQLKNGETKLIKLKFGNEIRHLSMKAKDIQLEEKTVKLVSVQDIKNELDAQELESWQKLIRVLTHEIMNSISPITSLSATIRKMLAGIHGVATTKEEKNEVIEDVLTGLNTINKRSQGLISFVESYRNLTRLPKPVFDTIDVKSLLDNIQNLLKKELSENDVQCSCQVSPANLVLSVDEKLVEQVLINLVKNAVQALNGVKTKLIEVRAFEDNFGHTIIQVKDNGEGMEAAVIEEIFTPFFTTREKGSGIGLSISRQIMQMHGGSISVASTPGEGSIFTLEFQAY